MWSTVRNLLLLATLLLGLVFAFFNLDPVRLDFLLGETHWPLVAALGAAVLLGFMLGVVSVLPALLRQRAALMAQRRRTGNAEAELKNLRNLPLSEP